MAGILVALTAFLQPQLCLAKPPKAFWCFFAYLLVANVFSCFLSPEYIGETLRHSWTLVQNLAMFWIGYNLMRDDTFVKWTLLSFGAGAVALALFAVLGISETAMETSAGLRVSALSENINMFGYLMALGALSLLGVASGPCRRQDNLDPIVVRANHVAHRLYDLQRLTRKHVVPWRRRLASPLPGRQVRHPDQGSVAHGGSACRWGARVPQVGRRAATLGVDSGDWRTRGTRRDYEASLRHVHREADLWLGATSTSSYVLAERTQSEYEVVDTHNDALGDDLHRPSWNNSFCCRDWFVRMERMAGEKIVPRLSSFGIVHGRDDDEYDCDHLRPESDLDGGGVCRSRATYIAPPTTMRMPQLRRNGP